MLKKLLKYDLKNIFKFLSVFYLLALFFSILTRIFLNIEGSFILNVIGKICSGTLIAMIANILINNLMRLWVRFRNNLYKDESYLTHTLPVEKKDLYLSKVITSIVSVLVSVIVIIITLIIAYYSKENMKFLKNLLETVVGSYNSTIVSFLALLFFEFINVIQIGYTGIILGHKSNSNKVIYSLVYGFISYIICQTFVLITLFGYAIFNKDIMNLFTSNNMTNVASLKQLLLVGTIFYALAFLINYFINVKIIKKGVNVD